MVGGTIDGRYHLLRALGVGGMGAVYEAQHVGTGRHVAVKVINPHMAGEDEIVRRFQREARAAGSIETPHIVQVFDTGTDAASGHCYMAMELLRGEDLQHLVKRLGKLPPELALRVLGQACIGLQKAHDAGVIHRDVKPANLFLAEGEGDEVVVKVVDFGIAKMLEGVTPEDAALTHTGGMLGSPLYMSPEQAMGSKAIDHRADIWSLGVVLYQMLAGRVPFPKGDTIVAIMMKICTEPVPPIQDVAPWVPPQIAEIVHRMLTIDPGARFPSVSALVEVMRPLLPRGVAIKAGDLVPLSPSEQDRVASRAVVSDEASTVPQRPKVPAPPSSFPVGEAVISVGQSAAIPAAPSRSRLRPAAALLIALPLVLGVLVALRLVSGRGAHDASAATASSAAAAMDRTPPVVNGSQEASDEGAVTAKSAIPPRLQVSASAAPPPVRSAPAPSAPARPEGRAVAAGSASASARSSTKGTKASRGALDGKFEE